MRAVVVQAHGGPEVLQVRQVPDREPEPGELLVAVGAAGVNFIDAYMRSGLYPTSLPFISGSEGAGLVRGVGATPRSMSWRRSRG